MTPLLLCLAVLSSATPPSASTRPTFSAGTDLPVAGALVGTWVVSETLLKKPLAPLSCRWCETNDFDMSVRRAFNPGLSPSPQGERIADISSGVVGFAVLPLALAGLDAWLLKTSTPDGWLEAWGIDVVIAAEATFGALVLNQLVKFSVGRARPFTVGASPGLLAQAVDPSDANLSFFSGHTTLSFGVVASLTTLAFMRENPKAPLLAIFGAPLALLTATLRLGADKHWASDVLLGMAVGTAFGIGVPLLFHRSQTAATTVRVTPTGNGVAVTGTF